MSGVARDELQGLLERCAESHGASQGVDGSFDTTREARWEDWEEQLLAPRVERDAEDNPPPGLSSKELNKWHFVRVRISLAVYFLPTECCYLCAARDAARQKC